MTQPVLQQHTVKDRLWIFPTNNVCDMDFEAVEWTRRWIAEVGDQGI